VADAQNNQKNQQQDLNQILKVRREKLAALQEAGKDPFRHVKYDVTAHSKDIVEGFEELEGKTVSIGEEESGTEQNAKQILAAYGLDEKLVKEVNLNYTDAAKQLQSGEIDALFCTSGVKTEMIEELANSCGIALLPVDGSAAARLLAAYPAYSQGAIPAGSYNGQDQDVPTIGVKAVLLASDELSENTVKALTKTLYDGVDTLQAELGLPLELGPADKIGVPVHAGAAAYYQENGMAAGEDAA